MYALVTEDEHGFVLGELSEVHEAAKAINEFLATGKDAGVIDNLDERFGFKWLTVEEAIDMAYKESRIDVPATSIRWSCRQGHIQGAINSGRQWRFPAMRFRGWLTRKYQPRKTNNKPAT